MVLIMDPHEKLRDLRGGEWMQKVSWSNSDGANNDDSKKGEREGNQHSPMCGLLQLFSRGRLCDKDNNNY